VLDLGLQVPRQQPVRHSGRQLLLNGHLQMRSGRHRPTCVPDLEQHLLVSSICPCLYLCVVETSSHLSCVAVRLPCSNMRCYPQSRIPARQTLPSPRVHAARCRPGRPRARTAAPKCYRCRPSIRSWRWARLSSPDVASAPAISPWRQQAGLTVGRAALRPPRRPARGHSPSSDGPPGPPWDPTHRSSYSGCFVSHKIGWLRDKILYRESPILMWTLFRCGVQ